jgi:tRNA (guanine-N7-)-methyltransferase
MFRPNPAHPYAHAAALPVGDEPVSLDSLFAQVAPIEIEIGPGRGGFLFERCASAPDANLLGLEIRRKWAHIVDTRLNAAGLRGRARSLAEDAGVALRRLMPSGSVRVVFLHFPDPWWKKRHEKRLVMKSTLLDEIARLLTEKGELYIQTDVEERALQYRAVVDAHGAFEGFGDENGSPSLIENPYGARSPREHRAIGDGLPVYRMRWRRTLASKGSGR